MSDLTWGEAEHQFGLAVWLGQIVEQGFEVRGAAGEEAALGEHREEHVLAALGGIGIAAEEAQEERDRRGEGPARRLGIVVPAIVTEIRKSTPES